jgi:hypothetical protein
MARIRERDSTWPNIAVEPTANSLRSCVAPAIGGGSPPALGSVFYYELVASFTNRFNLLEYSEKTDFYA